MKFTDTDIDDFNSVLMAMSELEGSGILLEHAVFSTTNDVKFLVSYKDPEFQIEVLPEDPKVPDTHTITFSDHGVKWSECNEWNPGWPPQGS